MANIANEYLVRRGTQEFATIASLFDGVRVLKIDGYTSQGAPKNIYTAAWVNSQKEDYLITDQQTIAGVDYDVVFRENVDLEITFAVSDKYTDNTIDVRVQHDAFIAYMTAGALYVKSNYANRTLRCVCLKDYKPTLQKLQRVRGSNYITGTLTLHILDVRAGDDDGYIGNPYPTPSDEGGDTPTPAQPIYTTQVVDIALNKTQAALNQEFHSKPSATFSYANEVLTITTQ